MNFFFVIRESGRDILAHKLRSALTILGIVFGVASLATMFAITAGMAHSLRERLVQTGDFEKLIIRGSAPPAHQRDIADLSPGLTYLDAIALRKSSPLIRWVSPVVNHNGWIQYQDRGIGSRVAGGEPEFMTMDVHQILAGRGIHPIDLERHHRVAVLGSRVWQELFSSPQAALGQTININGESFTVIGCLPVYRTSAQERAAASGLLRAQEERRAQRGSRPRHNRHWDAFPWKNHIVLIPLTTMQSTFKSARMETGVDLGPDPYLSDLQVGVADVSQIATVAEQIQSTLLLTHRGIEDFEIQTKLEEIKKIETDVWRTRFSGSLIAGIGLVVGGIGITNIMLASIVDRIREIGIRQAVGARPRDVFLQVLVEAVLLAFIGGIIGLVAAFGMISFLDKIADIATPPIIEPSGLAASVIFALVTGILAGVYPAIKASSLRPVEALKFD
ncbi:MAG: ABC transporter permease [Candidatus Methylacidiphilales bacterium]